MRPPVSPDVIVPLTLTGPFRPAREPRAQGPRAFSVVRRRPSSSVVLSSRVQTDASWALTRTIRSSTLRSLGSLSVLSKNKHGHLMARSVITRADASPSYIIPTNGPAFLRMHHQSATNFSLSLWRSLAGFRRRLPRATSLSGIVESPRAG